ncbi:MAG: CPBP family intramembrane metalloprotease [Anaerolineae bacterium]|nr:CPBP family intramembrane metalloprotease [Anaerolineae bacterium]
MVSRSTAMRRSWVLEFSLARPVLTSLILLAIALLFKWVDTFVLRLDERLGEIILSKTLGFLLVAVFVWAAGRSLRDIGLHARRLGQSLLIGVGAAAVTLVASYAVEFVVQLPDQPVFQLAAIDPKAGVSGGFLFALWLVLGNVVNSSMEEGLFRGVMGRLFRIRFSFWGAIMLQAFLFGLWHLPWVLKWYQTGQIEEQGGVAFAALGQFLPMLLVGITWGYAYLKTGSLWVPWIFHFLSNSTFNLLHITTVEGFDSGAAIRGPVAMVVALLTMLLIKYLAERYQMPEVKPWGQWAES